MKDSGWICLHRDLKNKSIWANGTMEQRIIFLILLTMANHTYNKWEWKGEVYSVAPGQFITSVKSIVKECDCKYITDRKVRTALERFQKLGFLTYETSNKNTLITIVNWDKYQNPDLAYTERSKENAETNTDRTSKKEMAKGEKTDVKQMAANNNENNENNENNINSAYRDAELSTCVQTAVEEWNSLDIYGIKKAMKIVYGSERRKNLNAIIKQFGINAVIAAIDNIRSSEFLRGKNRKGWKVSFDWFVTPQNFQKVMEGNYNDSFAKTNEKKSTGNPFLDKLHEMEEQERKEKGDIIDV